MRFGTKNNSVTIRDENNSVTIRDENNEVYFPQHRNDEYSLGDDSGLGSKSLGISAHLVVHSNDSSMKNPVQAEPNSSERRCFLIGVTRFNRAENDRNKQMFWSMLYRNKSATGHATKNNALRDQDINHQHSNRKSNNAASGNADSKKVLASFKCKQTQGGSSPKTQPRSQDSVSKMNRHFSVSAHDSASRAADNDHRHSEEENAMPVWSGFNRLP